MKKEIEIPVNPSKTQKKKEAAETQILGARLTLMQPNELDRLDLDPKLRIAIDDYKNLPKAHGARKRQIQFIGKVMRNFDNDIIKKRISSLNNTNKKSLEEASFTDELVEKIVDEGDTIINELISNFKNLERQKLRKFQREILKLHPKKQNDMKTKLGLYLQNNIGED